MNKGKQHLGYKPNTKGYRILTPYGYEVFSGMNKIVVEKHIRVKFKGVDEVIRCSLHHPFIDQYYNMIKAKDLTYKHRIKTKDGLTKIERMHIVDEPLELYDIINSGSDHVYYTNGVLSHNCEFAGSDGTLINGKKLSSLTYEDPLTTYDEERLKIYEEPIEDHSYVLIADTSEGIGEDYSFINIIDVTELPYRQVFTYSSNTIVPNMFASIIGRSGKKYNNALALVESNNSSGGIVLEILYNDIEYDNLMMSMVKDSQVVASWGGRRSTPGVRTTKTTKSIGCSYLKDMIESDQLIVRDWQTFTELSTFIRKGKSYEAKKGSHDDAVMTLVMFSWLTSQPYFEDLTGINSGKSLRDALSSKNDNNDFSKVFGSAVYAGEQDDLDGLGSGVGYGFK